MHCKRNAKNTESNTNSNNNSGEKAWLVVYDVMHSTKIFIIICTLISWMIVDSHTISTLHVCLH